MLFLTVLAVGGCFQQGIDTNVLCPVNMSAKLLLTFAVHLSVTASDGMRNSRRAVLKGRESRPLRFPPLPQLQYFV